MSEKRYHILYHLNVPNAQIHMSLPFTREKLFRQIHSAIDLGFVVQDVVDEEKEQSIFDTPQERADRVANACSATLISDLKYALYNYRLTFAHVETARVLRDAGHMDVPWIHAVANATEESDMEAVCDIACMALEEEGEE